MLAEGADAREKVTWVLGGLMLLLASQLAYGLVTGRLRGRHGIVARRDAPAHYALLVVQYSILLVAFGAFLVLAWRQ